MSAPDLAELPLDAAIHIVRQRSEDAEFLRRAMETETRPIALRFIALCLEILERKWAA